MDITQERFSTDVNSKFGFTEEEVGDYLTKFAATRSTSQATNRLNGKNPAKFLSGYGCWCRFGATNLKKGHGKTVDDIDKLCKTLTHGYECLKIDSTEDGTVPFCDPITTDYNFDIAKFLLVSNSFPAESLEDNCKNNNPGNACAEQTCIIELSSLVDLKLGLYKHSKGSSMFFSIKSILQTLHISSEVGSPSFSNSFSSSTRFYIGSTLPL